MSTKLNLLTEAERQQHDNHAILHELERQRDQLTFACYASGVSLLTGFTFTTLLAPALMPPLAILLGKLQTVSQQVALMRRLIEAFGTDGIEIHLGLQPAELPSIDLFLKFPGKKFIVIKIASLGRSVVSYNEQTEKLQYRRREVGKKRGLKNWEPDQLSVLNLQAMWIGRERRDLKGGSSRDARRPVAKMIALWGETKLGDHNEHLYSTMAGYQALWVRKFGATCIVEEDQVIEAIKAYLAKDGEQSDQV